MFKYDIRVMAQRYFLWILSGDLCCLKTAWRWNLRRWFVKLKTIWPGALVFPVVSYGWIARASRWCIQTRPLETEKRWISRISVTQEIMFQSVFISSLPRCDVCDSSPDNDKRLMLFSVLILSATTTNCSCGPRTTLSNSLGFRGKFE